MVSTIQAVQAAEPDSVTVYSSRKEHLIKPLFEAFTEDTGIRVKYLTGNGGSLLERIRFEGKNTNADIYMRGSEQVEMSVGFQPRIIPANRVEGTKRKHTKSSYRSE